MDLVIDTSALMAVLLAEPERPQLLARTRGKLLFVPPSVPWEIGNAVVSLIRRSRITTKQGQAMLRAFEKIPVRVLSISVRHAVRIATSRGLYAYDAYLIEAARIRGCPLLTLDRTLKVAANRSGIVTVEVST